VGDFPRPLAKVLSRALARDRDRRYPSAADLARDLDAFARSGSGAGANFTESSESIGMAPDEVRTESWAPLAALMRELFGPADVAAEAMLAFSPPTIFALADPGLPPTGTVDIDLCAEPSTLATAALSPPSTTRNLPLFAVSVVVAVLASATLLATCAMRY
jgi:hypothetical protein